MLKINRFINGKGNTTTDRMKQSWVSWGKSLRTFSSDHDFLMESVTNRNKEEVKVLCQNGLSHTNQLSEKESRETYITGWGKTGYYKEDSLDDYSNFQRTCTTR